MNLIIGVGTTGSAVVRGAEYRAVRRRGSAIRRLVTATGADRERLLDEVDTVDHRVRFRACDIDPTNKYRLPEMPGDPGGWQPGTFTLAPIPGQAAMARIRAGETHLVDFVNPGGLLDDPNASGGTRPNGYLAYQANSDRIQAELRRDLDSLLSRRQIRATPQVEGIRVFPIVGLLGGFGTGAWPCLRATLVGLSEEFGVRLDITPIFILPGVHPSKDRVNSHGAAYGVLKETVAESSDYRWMRDSSRGLDCSINERVRFLGPVLISDTNNAPNRPKILSVENLLAMAVEIVDAWVFTPIGGVLEAQLGDFTKAGSRLTPAGETCHGRTIGMGTIDFNRERQFSYSSAIAELVVLERAAQEGNEDIVRREALSFLDGMNLGYASLPQGTAGELMRRVAGARLSPGRFRSLFRAACDRLAAREVLRSGRNRCDLARAQAGDFEAGVEQEVRVFAEEAASRLAAHVGRMLCDPNRGPAYAAHWIRVCGGCVDGIIALYREECLALQEKNREASARAEAIEEEFQQDARSAGAIWEMWNGARLEQAGQAYRRELERAGVADLERQACVAAGHALDAIRENLEQAWSGLRGVQPAVAAGRESVLTLKATAAAEPPDFFSPNGLALLRTEEDLVDLDRRTFTAEDREAITAELFTALSATPDPLAVWSDTQTLLRVLHAGTERSLLARKVDGIHVWNELDHRFGDNSAVLGSVLRERDLESYEWLPLNPSTRATVVRMAGADAQCMEALKPLLKKFTTTRDTDYIPVETDDHDRLVFVQFRAAFPLTDWRLMPAVRADYLLAYRENPFEKHHVYPGDRFLPDPGIRLGPEDRAVMAVRAAILGRLRWESDRAAWVLDPADHSELPTALGASMEGFESQMGFRLAVDLTSHFTCYYMEHGPEAIQRSLSALRGGEPGSAELSRTLRPGDLARAYRRLDAELDWWGRNSVPASMEWARRQRLRLVASDGEAA